MCWPARPSRIQVTIDRKAAYDSDDMKVTLDGSRLVAIGKTLPAERADAESIGFLRFMGEGPALFRAKLEQMMRTQDGVSSWFLKAIDAIAEHHRRRSAPCRSRAGAGPNWTRRPITRRSAGASAEVAGALPASIGSRTDGGSTDAPGYFRNREAGRGQIAVLRASSR